MSLFIQKIRLRSLILLVAAFTTTAASVLLPFSVSALSGSEFNPGRIIDDGIFTNYNTMSTQDIQNFLNAKVPVCDTGGTKASSHPNGSGGYYTRAQWGALNGNPAPYTCLRDYVENISTKQNNFQSPNTPVPGGNSAAQIIATVARAYQINPQVILVTLQKEQGLITDDWPWATEYRSAMGYGCPDTAACDTKYYGFYNQVDNAARQFKYYLEHPNAFNYWTGNNYIQYNPNASCGGSVVNIQNPATAALYIYTPYQPNAGSLANLSDSNAGGTATCGAYGNRNFWWYFNTWFGDSIIACGNNEPIMPQVVSMYNPKTYDHFYTAYACEANVLGYKQGYTYEGAMFNTTAVNPSGVPVWRLYNPSTGQHLWTTSQADIDNAKMVGYTQEGIAYYTAPANAPRVTPVYRLYNASTYQHVWDLSQGNAATQQAGFKLEGPAFYSQ